MDPNRPDVVVDCVPAAGAVEVVVLPNSPPDGAGAAEVVAKPPNSPPDGADAAEVAVLAKSPPVGAGCDVAAPSVLPNNPPDAAGCDDAPPSVLPPSPPRDGADPREGAEVVAVAPKRPEPPELVVAVPANRPDPPDVVVAAAPKRPDPPELVVAVPPPNRPPELGAAGWEVENKLGVALVVAFEAPRDPKRPPDGAAVVAAAGAEPKSPPPVCALDAVLPEACPPNSPPAGFGGLAPPRLPNSPDIGAARLSPTCQASRAEQQSNPGRLEG